MLFSIARYESERNQNAGFYFEIGVILLCSDPWRSYRFARRPGGTVHPVWTVDFGQVNVRRDEAPSGRSRAAVGGRLLRLPAATERRQRAVEADAAGRAVTELHAGGEEDAPTDRFMWGGTESRQGQIIRDNNKKSIFGML